MGWDRDLPTCERVDAFDRNDALVSVRRVAVPTRGEGGRRELERRRIDTLIDIANDERVHHARLLPHDDAKPIKFTAGDLVMYRTKENDRGEA